jgi:hypothetical protein
MQHPGWVLVIIGGLIAVMGLAWLLAPSIPWLRLPGDIVIERENSDMCDSPYCSRLAPPRRKRREHQRLHWQSPQAINYAVGRGRLPVAERQGYFRIATCILLSLLLTAIMWLVRRFSG